MGEPTPLTEIEQQIDQRFGLSRGVLLAVGIACIILGGIAMLLPVLLFRSIVKLVGVLLLVSGAVKAAQALLGRTRQSARTRGWPLILIQVVIDVAMGLLLLNQWHTSVHVVAMAFGALFIIEGLVLFYTALRSPTLNSRRMLIVTGAVTLLIGVDIVLGWVADPLRWAGLFVGLKLLMFGGALTWISLCARRTQSALLYAAPIPELEVGELYAVYFGTAFHLGVFIGDGEVVHYLNDNHVYRVTWDQFLSGRVPQHWTYPDLEPVPVETIIATALSEVGKTYPYSLLKFNCENFAIFCKSGGKTTFSKYGQVASGVASLATHPLIGLVAELNTRAVEWLAFHFGGPAGRRLSLAIRWIGSAVTNLLISSGHPARAGRPGD